MGSSRTPRLASMALPERDESIGAPGRWLTEVRDGQGRMVQPQLRVKRGLWHVTWGVNERRGTIPGSRVKYSDAQWYRATRGRQVVNYYVRFL